MQFRTNSFLKVQRKCNTLLVNVEEISIYRYSSVHEK